MRGRVISGPLCLKRGLVVQKVITPKNVSPGPKGDGLWAFAWKQPKAFSRFIKKGSGSKQRKSIVSTLPLGAHEKWKKGLKCQKLGHIYPWGTKAHIIWHMAKLEDP